ncbi:MAG TPA: DUF1566 domain-containing protein [Epsilonproteobacteria bacterium]|nr:DUF1566 domain-containing protein [Campylobacterota bacterium]
MKRMMIWMALGCLVPTLLSADRFAQSGEVVRDGHTGLSWQSTPADKKFSWSGAQEHCDVLNYGGYSDWRLPNLYELKSLVDYDKYNPALATTRIQIKTDDYYWSSSKDVSDSSGAWGVYFKNGGGIWGNKANENYVLCVRGQ